MMKKSTLPMFSVPDAVVSCSTMEIPVNRLVTIFHPRDQDYMDAGYSREDVEQCQQKTEIHIPEYQRDYVWSNVKASKLVDSIFLNYPIPKSILFSSETRGLYFSQDGQQRAISLWRFYHNLVPYIPSCHDGIEIYYSRIPVNHPSKDRCFVLTDKPEDKKRFDHYKISFDIVTTLHGVDKDDVIPDMFERINSGVPLSDADRLWNRNHTIAVDMALRMAKDPVFGHHMKDVLGIDLKHISNNTPKTHLPHMTAIILGLSQDIQKVEWANCMTTSFAKVYHLLEDDIPHPNHIMLFFTTLFDILKTSKKGIDNYRIPAKFNKSLQRHLGIMIYDWRLRTQGPWEGKDDVPMSIVEEYSLFWKNVIGYFQSVVHRREDGSYECIPLNHVDHPIQCIYTDRDNVRKNTNIHKGISQRHQNLMNMVSTWKL